MINLDNPFLMIDQGSDEVFIKIDPFAIKLLGIPGRMMYRSKSLGRPSTIFNANIFDEKASKIWFGDLEIERDREKLLSLAEKVGTLYILNEMDGRFLKFPPTPSYIKTAAKVCINSGGRILYDEQWVSVICFREKRLLKESYEKQKLKLIKKISRVCKSKSRKQYIE